MCDILLLYHEHLNNAPMMMEHVNSFKKYSKHKVYPVNVVKGPLQVPDKTFPILVMHWTILGGPRYNFALDVQECLRRHKNSYKVAFYQDDYRFCKRRFWFINEYEFDCIYTLLEERFFPQVYGKYTTARHIYNTLPGYVEDDLIERAKRIGKKDEDRTIDIGYRGRTLNRFMGREAREKSWIAAEFLRRAVGLGFNLDIAAKEKDRIYGPAWYEFLADCKGTLGVEGGVSVFDIQDQIREQWEKVTRNEVELAEFPEDLQNLLDAMEGNIYYRLVTPRTFEGAVFRVCPILFEGNYSGILKPRTHYIPLKKDFSNFDEVIRLFKDPAVRKEITDNAYRDLVESGKYSYRKFIEEFDENLKEALGEPK